MWDDEVKVCKTFKKERLPAIDSAQFTVNYIRHMKLAIDISSVSPSHSSFDDFTKPNEDNM